MAELEQNGAQQKRSMRIRSHRLSTRIDMTPMVDLAFLLVTFFMLTTSFVQPRAMELQMPVQGPPTLIPSSEAITIIVAERDQLFYYFGDEEISSLHKTEYSASGIRKVLTEKNNAVRDKQFQAHKKVTGAYVLLKPDDHATYQNVIDMLDELKISGINSYALLDLSKEEKEALGN